MLFSFKKSPCILINRLKLCCVLLRFTSNVALRCITLRGIELLAVSNSKEPDSRWRRISNWKTQMTNKYNLGRFLLLYKICPKFQSPQQLILSPQTGVADGEFQNGAGASEEDNFFTHHANRWAKTVLSRLNWQQLKTLHRYRIQVRPYKKDKDRSKGKGRVWGEEFIQFLAALTGLPRTILIIAWITPVWLERKGWIHPVLQNPPRQNS